MRLEKLLKTISVESITGNANIDIFGISCDSRKVGKNYLFVCIDGFKTDGHLYIKDAVNRGAIALVVGKNRRLKPATTNKNITIVKVQDMRLALGKISAEFYGNPSKKIKVIGITGTNGKTTSAFLIESILKKARLNPGVIGTIVYKIGKNEIAATNTTPESLEIQKIFSEMLRNNCDCAVMEISSHALELNRVASTEFDVAIFTNLTQDHLDFHKSMNEYLNAKTKLFKLLNLSSKKSKVAILNLDDSHSKYIQKFVKTKILTYGINPKADIFADNIKLDICGTSFNAGTPAGEILINLKLKGLHNIYNALCAISVGIFYEIPLSIIKQGIESVHSVSGRFEMINVGNNINAVVDYAHTPDALEKTLKAISQFKPKRIITLFGCGGERDKLKRPIMGKIASVLSDFVVLTSDNPRSEDPKKIILEVARGIKKIKKKNYTIVVDREKAIRKILNYAKSGDVILFAGKGHENYQILKDKTIPFSDKEIIKKWKKSQLMK